MFNYRKYIWWLTDKELTELSDSRAQSRPLWTGSFVLLILANFGVYVFFYMMIPCLPIFVKEITGQDALSGLAMTVFLIAAVLYRPFAGRQVDSGNRKSYFLLGVAIIFIGALAISLAPTLAVLLPARFVQGLGWAYCNTAAGTIAVDVIPKARLAEGIGYYGLSLTVAMGAGPALGLFTMQHYGSQAMFYVSAGFVLLSFLLALLIKYHYQAAPKAKAAFNVDMLVERRALLPSLVIFAAVLGYAAVTLFLPLYAQQRQVSDVSLFFLVYAASITFIRPLMGRIADRRGFMVVIMPGLLVCMVSMLIIYMAHSLAAFIIVAVIFGVGYGAVQSTQALAVAPVPPERRGAATATFFMFMDLSLGVASILWGVVAHLLSYDIMYLTVIIPFGAALLLYLFIERQAGKQRRLNQAAETVVQK